MISLYGAGGHAKVVMDILRSIGEEIGDVFDDDPEHVNLIQRFDIKLFTDATKSNNRNFIISIGDNSARKRVAEKINQKYTRAIFPNAIISEHSEIGSGTVIMQNVVIQADAKIGLHCIINTSSVVEHDVSIADFVHVAPGVTICGGCNIDEGVLIGAGSIILPNLKIGKWSVIGAGSVVTKNISEYSIVTGNPAKETGTIQNEE